MKIEIFLMSGAGNLFTVLDNRNHKFSNEKLSNISTLLCNSFENITTEGLMALNSDDKNDFNIQFFNPDGSSGMMCGNGGRCAVRFAEFLGLINKKNDISFSMAGKIYNAWFLKNNIKLEFNKPKEISKCIKLKIDNKDFIGDFIDIGSDHFIYFAESIENRRKLNNFTSKYGYKIRSNSFFEKGTNANFYFIKNNKIFLSTFERGVEKITGACGTGSISTAISAVENNQLDFPITIIPPSGQKLIIDIDENRPNKIYLTGNAKILQIKLIKIEN